ncbi:MAG: right-handed parallel beta-helix repeat-containing protein [Geminicoccaceae bacterium]
MLRTQAKRAGVIAMAVIVLCSLTLSLSAWAEMLIETNDGRRIVIPVEERDIASITFRRAKIDARSAEQALADNRARASGRILEVGPDGQFTRPSEAARAAKDGDTVTIAAGIYPGDVAVWKANDLTIQGVGGLADIRANGRHAQGKGIWVIRGSNVVIENVKLSGAVVPDHNGAGIRFEGTNLTLRHSVFTGNQTGLLTANNPNSDIIIENCLFDRNWFDFEAVKAKGVHNMYIGKANSFTLRGSHIVGNRFGHNVKSRARLNIIEYNLIEDGSDGFASYQIDLPNGGDILLKGNVIHQSERAKNYSIISIGTRPDQVDSSTKMAIVYNTLINDLDRGTFINNRAGQPVLVAGNIFVGAGKPIDGRHEDGGNVSGNRRDFIEADGGIWRPRPDGSWSDLSGLPTTYGPFSLVPEWEYAHPSALKQRARKDEHADAGAFEAPS